MSYNNSYSCSYNVTSPCPTSGNNKRVRIPRLVDLQKRINNNNLRNVTCRTSRNLSWNVSCLYLYIKIISIKLLTTLLILEWVSSIWTNYLWQINAKMYTGPYWNWMKIISKTPPIILRKNLSILRLSMSLICAMRLNKNMGTKCLPFSFFLSYSSTFSNSILI